jgi:hypothetical protein
LNYFVRVAKNEPICSIPSDWNLKLDWLVQ